MVTAIVGAKPADNAVAARHTAGCFGTAAVSSRSDVFDKVLQKSPFDSRNRRRPVDSVSLDPRSRSPVRLHAAASTQLPNASDAQQPIVRRRNAT
jgi:hypothetical protein